MSTIRILLGIVCLVTTSCSTEPDGGVLGMNGTTKDEGTRTEERRLRSQNHDSDSIVQREKMMVIARSQIGVREATGNNDGLAIVAYLEVTKLPKGNPWCAAFVSWVFSEAGFAKPRTAWSPALFPMARSTLKPKPADVLGIYAVKLKRIAHAGLVERRQHNWIISIEGNTNTNGSREGDGVYRKWRHIRTIAKFADWVK